VLPQATADFYRGQQRQAVATMGLTRREWARMGTDFDRSWIDVRPRLLLLAGSAQLGSARAGAAYVPKVLAETGQVDDAAGLVNASAFAGVASDGRPLDTLLYGAVTQAKSAVGAGASASDALQSGGTWLDMVVRSLIADAGRMATSAGIAARPRVGGYVRMLNPPSCNRCAVLAGKWFRYNQGFRRHPRCDCVHIPSSENIAGDLRTDTTALFDRGLITGLTPAQSQAISEGADIAKVVNATRGMSAAVQVAGGRLTPEGIYQRASSRQDAIKLLTKHGYLI
jgi:hypothetical protein